MICPCLHIPKTLRNITCLYNKLITEDIRKLCAIAVLTTHNLLLFLVVVAASEQVTKDEFRRINLVLGMLLDRNTLSVIFYRDLKHTLCSCTDLNTDRLNGLSSSIHLRTHKSIPGIYKNLVKELVESRIKCRLAIRHLLLFLIVNPTVLLVSFYRTNIGIWKLEDVVTVSQTLVLFGTGHLVYFI